jgi:lambda family phage portal protein
MTDRSLPPAVRWGLIDSAVQLVSPGRALQRYRARVAAANLRRSYDGASKGRDTHGWRAPSTSADAEIAVALPVLRDRMRDLVRNNPLAAQAVQVLVNNMVGTGIRPRAASGNSELDARVNALWARWAARCDAHGHTDFHGLVQLAVRQMIEGGDALALRRRPRRFGRGDLPLRIELREPDHLDDARMAPPTADTRIEQGIEFDLQGRRLAYWLFPDHPGGRASGAWRRLESVRVPAEDVAHLFERQRPQSRGVPWGTPALTALQHLGDWQDAELVRKKIEASVVGFVFGDLDDSQRSIAPKVRDAAGQEVEQFEPGMIAYVDGGKDIKFNAPSAHPGIREWNLVQMHIIAAGFRVPYALMTGDMSQANFSSTRAGLNEFRRMIESVQWLAIVPMLCNPIWRWFLEAAADAGEIDAPDVPVEWGPPKFESVNPWQDAQTDLLEVRAGFASLPQMVAKRGWDTGQVLQEQAEALAKAKELGLVLDSDGSQTSRAGQMQPGSAPAPTPTTDE